MSYLTSHGKTYYFRYFVPPVWQPLVGQKIIKKSLGTGNKRIAQRLATRLQSITFSVLTAIQSDRSMITPEKLQQMLDQYFFTIINEDEQRRSQPHMRPLEIAEFERLFAAPKQPAPNTVSSDLVFNHDGKPIATSLQVAQVLGKEQTQPASFLDLSIEQLSEPSIEDDISALHDHNFQQRQSDLRFIAKDIVRNALQSSDYTAATHYIDDFLKREHIFGADQSEIETLTNDKVAFNVLCRKILITTLDALGVCDARDTLDYDTESNIRSKYNQHHIQLDNISLAKATADIVVNELREYTPIPIDECIKIYLSDQTGEDDCNGTKSKPKKKSDTIYKERLVLNEFAEFARHYRIENTKDITHEVCKQYINALKNTPPNYSKKYPTKGIFEISQMRHSKTLHERTINERKGIISHFFKDTIGKGNMGCNFMAMKYDYNAPDETANEPYTENDLCKIFNSSLYLSKKIDKTYKYWLIPMALLTGCRLAELCRLKCEDVQQEKGIWYIKIRDGKTPTADRNLPLHPLLIDDLGFLSFVESQRSAGFERIFPDASARNDKYGKDASQWYNKTFIKKLNLDPITREGGRKTFHSLRATSMRIAKEARCDGQISSEYFAHYVGNGEPQASKLTISSYPGKYSVKLLYEEVTLKLTLPCDISHLAPWNKHIKIKSIRKS